MKLLVVLVAIAILPLDSFGNEFTRCTALFQAAGRIEDSFAATKIIRENDEAYFNATESEMTKAEWDHLVYIFREKTKRLQGRTVTHMGKTAVSEGNKVTVSQTLIGNKKIIEKQFSIDNTNGFFEPERGQLWIMPHNEGRLVVWSFSKDKVFEVTLPEKGTFVEARFDYTSNIYQPKMIVEYEPHPFGAEVVGTKEIEINLITGKEV